MSFFKEVDLVHGTGAGWQTARDTGVCEKNTSREESVWEDVFFQSTKAGGGEQYLLLDCRATTRMKGNYFHRFTDAGILGLHSHTVRHGTNIFGPLGSLSLLIASIIFSSSHPQRHPGYNYTCNNNTNTYDYIHSVAHSLFKETAHIVYPTS